MVNAFLDVLPFTAGLILTPFAIIAVIVLLISDNGTSKALVLDAVFLVATFVVTLLVAEFAGSRVASTDQRGDFGSIVILILGLVLFVLAVFLVRRSIRRAQSGESAQPPRWLGAADHASVPTVVGIALALVFVNPLNLSMLVVAGVTLGRHDLPFGQNAVVCAVFAVIGSIGLLAPTVLAVVRRLRRRVPLRQVREWLVLHNRALVIGTTVTFAFLFLSKGLRGLVG